ncbi:hypothetical protein [Caulobacter mirabilis]|uniref:Protein activator of alkane oxidation PraB n=1 Tax=Caulobacter mirabilis TaxID=69666 RepID=A0A2D2AXV1_9CAUL|nr:hypothetical protein [Caulobacter mirabilis]ATQ42815.1 hypothetical protein CSW64_10550 [Caulobacter mirabilis]
MKTVLFAAAALAAISMSGAASAQTFTSAPGQWSLQGQLQMGSGITVQCNVDLTLQVNAAGNGQITSATIAPGHPVCATVLLSGFGWPALVTSSSSAGGMIDVTGFTSSIPPCNGTLSGIVIDGPNQDAKFDMVYFPGGGCFVDGTLNITPISPTTMPLQP